MIDLKDIEKLKISNAQLLIGLVVMFIGACVALFAFSYTLVLTEKERETMWHVSHEKVEYPKQNDWSFDGFFGTVDRASAQRGLQVYKEVCAACHGAVKFKFRNMAGIGFSEDEIKAYAAEFEYEFINEDGDTETRPGVPNDKFKSPYANKQAAAAANGGKMPPDLSLMVKARKDGANYLHSLLTGYYEAPADFDLGAGLYYNPYFPGMQISMAPPLMTDQVEYADGTEATVEQMSKDVVSFLQYAAEPEMEERKRMGIKAMIFLAIMTLFFYIAKVRIWARVK